jgi:hypothetical protein
MKKKIIKIGMMKNIWITLMETKRYFPNIRFNILNTVDLELSKKEEKSLELTNNDNYHKNLKNYYTNRINCVYQEKLI